MAVTSIANQITAGQIDIGLGLGVESMSQFPDSRPTFSDEIMAHPVSRDCTMPMGWTSENVALDFDVSREEMDQYAAQSFQRAERAQNSGYFDNEIVPFTAFVSDPSGGRKAITVSRDDGVRHGTTKEALAKVRPAFPQWGKGVTTGGNASQITDGVASVILMRRSKAEELGLKILAKYVTTAVSGT
jgi:acetyl-CoA acyltransferase 1